MKDIINGKHKNAKTAIMMFANKYVLNITVEGDWVVVVVTLYHEYEYKLDVAAV